MPGSAAGGRLDEVDELDEVGEVVKEKRLGLSASLRRTGSAVLPHLMIFVMSFLLLLTVLREPRTLTADEVDTLRGGRQLVDLMTAPDHDPRLAWGDSLRGRLRAGFTTHDNPRFTVMPDSAPRRAVVEAPVPRWLAALGIGVLPASRDATNLDRARVASSLALALALALLSWSRRRAGLVQVGFIVAAAFAIPGFFDAGASAGYAAASVLTMTLFLQATQRLIDTGRGALWVGLSLGLCFGVHPLHLVLIAVVFIAYAIARSASPPWQAPATMGHDRVDTGGLVRLPAAPVGLFLIPVVAIATLILFWPILWSDTGKRLGAWIADFGSLSSPPVEVAGLAFDQAAFRTSQAWTALLQWLALTPLPLILLWGLGLGHAIRQGRTARWLPIITLVVVLLTAGLDGSLFGGRLSLIEALWAPTLLTAADGFSVLVGWVEKRVAALRPGHRILSWVTAWGLGVGLLLVPLVQAARGTGSSFVAHTGLEARFGLPLSLLHRAEEIVPNASLHVRPLPSWYKPALDVMWRDLESSLDWGTESAELLVTVGEPPADLSPRLIELLGRVEGSEVALWRLAPLSTKP